MALHPHFGRTIRTLAVTGWLAGSSAWAAGADLDVLFPHEQNGRVLFSLQATPDAQVALVGDFNNWDEHATPMHHAGDGVFEASVPLVPGSYQYKFIVNGRRRLDP
jgi:1,4-alpha-glucan branching enzyme